MDRAIVSGWNTAGEACLAAVNLNQPGVQITADGWQATGMAATGSVDVHFDMVPARAVGAPGSYVQRPGFWHGGAAAAWIDTHPQHSAQTWALRARLAVERDAVAVLHHAGRALGAGPLCQDAALGRAMADLPIFLRQSHAERQAAATVS